MLDQNVFIWVYLGWNSKNRKCYCTIVFLYQHPQIFSNKILFKKKKIFKFETKISLNW